MSVIVLKMILAGLRISHSEPMSTRTDPEQIMNNVSILRGKKNTLHNLRNIRSDNNQTVDSFPGFFFFIHVTCGGIRASS